MFTLIRWGVMVFALVMLVGWATSVGTAHAVPDIIKFSQHAYHSVYQIVGGLKKS